MRRLLRFGACDGVLPWEEGSENMDLRMVVRWNLLFQVFVRWLPV